MWTEWKEWSALVPSALKGVFHRDLIYKGVSQIRTLVLQFRMLGADPSLH